MLLKNLKKGFSLVELVIVIAILAILIAVLAPSLMTYTERSRAQKDVTTMDEVVNAVQLAMADQDCYDEMIKYSCNNNFITYTDSSGNYGQVVADGEFWAPDGLGRATTITFNPEKTSTGDTIYRLENAIVNDMTYGNGSVADNRVIQGAQTDNTQCYLKNASLNGAQTGYLYNYVRQTIGNDVITTSATYANSSFTVFIKFNQKDGVTVADVEGSFNGTNLSPDSMASKGSGTTTYDPTTKEPIVNTNHQSGTTQSEFKGSALQGTGNFSGSQYLTEYNTSKESGLFDANGNQLADWHTLVKTHGLDISKNYSQNTVKTDKTSLSYILSTYYPSASSIVVDGSVSQIGKMAFSDCDSLQIIKLSDGVQSIGQYAFRYSKAHTIEMADSVTFIDQYAFWLCVKLKSVTLSNSIDTIPAYCFQYCDGLTSIKIPDSVKTLGYSCFYECENLTTVDLGDGVENISGYAFAYSKNLQTVKIGKGLNSLTYSSFTCCDSLANFEVSSSNPNYSTDGSRLFNKNKTELVKVPLGVTDYSIPSSVTVIGEGAFEIHKMESFVIPSHIKEIKAFAFNNCTSLKSVTLPSGLEVIGEGAFNFCTALTSITIPESVNYIGRYAFRYDNKLKTINLLSNSGWIAEYKSDWFEDEWTSTETPDLSTNEKVVQWFVQNNDYAFIKQ